MTTKPEAPRTWIIDDAYDLVAGPHPGQERIEVVELSAYAKVVKELEYMTEKFERNSIAAGDYSLQLEAMTKERDEALAANQQYISLFLHEQRMAAERERAKGLVEALANISRAQGTSQCASTPAAAQKALKAYSQGAEGEGSGEK